MNVINFLKLLNCILQGIFNYLINYNFKMHLVVHCFKRKKSVGDFRHRAHIFVWLYISVFIQSILEVPLHHSLKECQQINELLYTYCNRLTQLSELMQGF